MANTRIVTCRTLESSKCSHGYLHISRVGWVQAGISSGSSTRQEMVNWLNASTNNQALTQASNGQMVPIRVMRCGDHFYIETIPDSSKPDNLRELKPC